MIGSVRTTRTELKPLHYLEAAERTNLIELFGSPEGSRGGRPARRPISGRALIFTDCGGRRYHVFVIDLDDPDIAHLEVLYRGRDRAENRICDTKDARPASLPPANHVINSAWVRLVVA